MLLYFISGLSLLWFANGVTLYGVFTDIVSIDFRSRSNWNTQSPLSPSWDIILDWSLSGDNAKIGDTFTLNMPCVFRFTTASTTIDLEFDSTSYANCKLIFGELIVPYSQLECTVISILQPSIEYSGQITFPVTFNPGGSYNSNNYICASKFSNGIGSVINAVTFSDGQNSISSTADFVGGTLYGYDPSKIAYLDRRAPATDEEEFYLLAGDCPQGYESGTLAMEISSGIDCDSAVQQISNQLNAWYLPMESVASNFEYECNPDKFIIRYTNIASGYRPFISAVGPTRIGRIIHANLINTYKCVGSTSIENNSMSMGWVFNGLPGDSSPVTVVTSIWEQSTTGFTTLPFTSDGTKTIVVHIPTPLTTITSTWEESFTTTTTLPYTSGGTKTVIIEVPVPVTTTTRYWDSPFTLIDTLPYIIGGTKTVEIFAPVSTASTPFISNESLPSNLSITGSTTSGIKTSIPINPGTSFVPSTSENFSGYSGYWNSSSKSIKASHTNNNEFGDSSFNIDTATKMKKSVVSLASNEVVSKSQKSRYGDTSTYIEPTTPSALINGMLTAEHSNNNGIPAQASQVESQTVPTDNVTSGNIHPSSKPMPLVSSYHAGTKKIKIGKGILCMQLLCMHFMA